MRAITPTIQADESYEPDPRYTPVRSRSNSFYGGRGSRANRRMSAIDGSRSAW